MCRRRFLQVTINRRYQFNRTREFGETKFKDSIMKSRYLKMPSSPKFVIKLALSHRFRTTSSSDLDIFDPAVQSKQVDNSSSRTCHPDANQKKKITHP